MSRFSYAIQKVLYALLYTPPALPVSPSALLLRRVGQWRREVVILVS